MRTVNSKLALAAALACATAFSPSLRAVSNTGDSNPYVAIMDANIFRLNPTPPPKPVEEKPVELPKVYLSGIIKVGHDVKVLFSIPAKDAKSQATYHSLAPGQEDDVLKLVSIHPDEKEVEVVVNGNTPMTLSVTKDTLAPSDGMPTGRRGLQQPQPGPVAAAAGGASSSASAIIVGGGESSYGGGVSVAGGGVTTIGANNKNNSIGGGNGVITSGGGGYNPTAFGGGSYGGGVSVSGGNSVGSQLASALFNGTPAQGQTSGTTPTQPAAPPEVQAATMLAENQQLQSQGKEGPPLPPALAQLVGQDTSAGPPVPGEGGASPNPTGGRSRPINLPAPPPVP